jgi:hypothetical protein
MGEKRETVGTNAEERKMRNIYLVKWPDGSHSVAVTENHFELYELLDEQGNPRDCEWKELDMDLLFDVKVKEEIIDDDEIIYTYTLMGIGQDWDCFIEDILEEPFDSKFMLSEGDHPELDRIPPSGTVFGVFTNPKIDKG